MWQAMRKKDIIRRGRKPLVLALMNCLALASAAAGTAGAQDSVATATAPRALTLESLYHPENKFDFDGELPATHWIKGQPCELLIKRDETWKRLDLETGAESTWPVVEILQEKLAALEGIAEGQAKSAAISAVTDLESADDTVLVPVGKSLAIVSTHMQARWLTRDATAWRDAMLDPTSRRVAYTRDGDLFVLDAVGGKQVQLTNDGTDTLLDGLLDWTYQEEIFGRGNYRAFWFSPDGDWLAMLRIDISGIETYTLSSATSARGQGVVRRYPKAGDPIPHASLLVWDLRRLDAGDLPPPRIIAQSTPQQERIITGVWWNQRRTSLLFCVSDRKQTWRELRVLEVQALANGQVESQVLLREESPTWVEPPAAPGWLADGSLIWRSELPTGRTRLYHVSARGQLVEPLTPENFDVRDFSVSPQGDFLIATGDAQRRTVDQQVYRVAIPPNAQEPNVQDPNHRDPALTALTTGAGWHTATLSPDGKWFVDVQSSAASPPALSVRTTDGNRQLTVARSELRVKDELIEPQFFEIATPDGLALPAMLIRPPTPPDRKVPVVIEVYGGPQAALVVNRWSGTRTLYRQLLARHGIATLLVDNRSSAGRGLADTWSIRGRVGEIEFHDLMTAVAWLGQQTWADSDRLAIRGWSFGGFLTLYAMTHSDAFKAGIAGGSVTDWREYDAFYTERYMGLPNENADGYKATAPVQVANQLQGAVLLIHGESDDNVHPSETLRMAKALQEAGKDFRMMIYPGEAHAVHQPSQLWHLSQMTDRFLMEQLAGGNPSR